MSLSLFKATHYKYNAVFLIKNLQKNTESTEIVATSSMEVELECN